MYRPLISIVLLTFVALSFATQVTRTHRAKPWATGSLHKSEMNGASRPRRAYNTEAKPWAPPSTTHIRKTKAWDGTSEILAIRNPHGELAEYEPAKNSLDPPQFSVLLYPSYTFAEHWQAIGYNLSEAPSVFLYGDEETIPRGLSYFGVLNASVVQSVRKDEGVRRVSEIYSVGDPTDM